MSPDPDPETSGDASSLGLTFPDVQSSPNETLPSSESGSQPDDDLVHPAKRPRKGPAPRAINVWSHARSPLPHEPSRAPTVAAAIGEASYRMLGGISQAMAYTSGKTIPCRSRLQPDRLRHPSVGRRERPDTACAVSPAGAHARSRWRRCSTSYH